MHQIDVNRNYMTTTFSKISFKRSTHRKETWDINLLPCSVNPFWGSVVTFIVAVACFCNSVNGDFVFDDSEAVLNNNDVRPDTPIANMFRNDFWGTKLTHSTSHKSYRPLTILTFRLNFWLSGGLYSTSFHAVNVLLHGVVSVLVLCVLSSLYRTCEGPGQGQKAAFLGALLFAVHPIHTESVAGVVGRADLLSALFFLLSFLAYRQGCLEGMKESSVPMDFSLSWVLISLTLAGISMFSKEQGITVIGFCSCYDILLLCRLDVTSLLFILKKEEASLKISASKCSSWPRWLWPLCIRHMLLAIGGMTLLLTRWQVMGSMPPSFQPVDNPASFQDSLLLRAINYQYIYALNIWLLLQPWWLCFDWSMGCVPLILNLQDKRLAAVFALWVAASTLIYGYFRMEDKRLKRMLLMSLALTLIPFLPASNMFFRVGFVIAERVLYLPSIGFCCLVVLGLHQLCLSPALQQIAQVGFFFLIIIFGARSIQRTSEWKTEEILFNSGLKVCPLNAKVHYNIAKNSADRGDRDQAIYEYREAIALNPKYDQAMNNLANILKDQGRLQEAEDLLELALNIRSDFAAAWMNLGIVQAGMGKVGDAEKSYHTAIIHRKKYPDCYYNLGNLYLEQKRYDEAYKAWRNATIQRPTQLVAWNNMIVMLDNIGELKRAEIVAQEALRILPDEATLHFNLANTLGKLGKYKLSEIHFLKAIENNEHNPMYYTNLGVLYHLWGKYDLAEKAYHGALAMRPDMKRAHENLELLRRARNKHQHHQQSQTQFS